MAEYKIKDAQTANLDEIYFDKNVSKMCYKNALGIITTLETSGNVVQSVVAGTNVTVNNTDPANPVVNATGGSGGGLQGNAGIYPYYGGVGSAFGLNAAINASSMGVYNGSVSRVDLNPFLPNNDFLTISLNINITAAAVGGLMELLIYSNAGGVPSQKLYQSAQIDCSTTGIKTITTAFQFLKGITYWIGVLPNASISTTGISSDALMSLNTAFASGPTPTVGYSMVSTPIGTAPTTFNWNTYKTGIVPNIWIKPQE